MMKRTKVALVAGTAALALAGIGGGVAFATGSGSAAPSPQITTAASVTSGAAPSATASSAAAAKPKAKRFRNVLARTEHGEVTLRSKTGDKVFDLQRGVVTTVSSTSVTVKSKDGFTATYAVGSGAKVRKQKQASAIADVHTGDRVGVLALRSGSTDTLRRLRDAGPATK
jgi:hypothetical protein